MIELSYTLRNDGVRNRYASSNLSVSPCGQHLLRMGQIASFDQVQKVEWQVQEISEVGLNDNSRILPYKK